MSASDRTPGPNTFAQRVRHDEITCATATSPTTVGSPN